MKDAHENYSDNQIKEIDFSDSVRKRPFMYIGNNGIIDLLEGVLIDCIEICKTDKIIFELVILDDNKFTLGLSSQHDIEPFVRKFLDEINVFPNCFPRILKIVSETFEIITNKDLKTSINFSFDKSVITDTCIDYLKLSEKMIQIALLNRQCEIITIDKRQKYQTQNYYHFPQGVLYIFDRLTKEALGKPEFKITYDDMFGSYHLQIGLAYRTDWFPNPTISSFANNINTVHGGSLVDGILEGLVTSIKSYVKENNLLTFKINPKKFENGLILVCAIRGQEFNYGGSFREKLEDDDVRKKTKQLISSLVSNFIKTEKEKSAKFLWRFDTSQLTSGMF